MAYNFGLNPQAIQQFFAQPALVPPAQKGVARSQKGPLAENPWAQQYDDQGNPITYNWDPGHPRQYTYIADLRNLLTREILGGLGQQGMFSSGQQPFINPQGAQDLQGTLGALQGWSERQALPLYANAQGWQSPTNINLMSGPARNQLNLQEVSRVSNLLKVLLGLYGLGGAIQAQSLGSDAALRQMREEGRSSKRSVMSQIPLIGGFF